MKIYMPKEDHLTNLVIVDDKTDTLIPFSGIDTRDVQSIVEYYEGVINGSYGGYYTTHLDRDDDYSEYFPSADIMMSFRDMIALGYAVLVYDSEAPAAEPEETMSIQERFEEFHSKNPEVYDRLVEMSRRWKEKTGETKVGIGMLFEVLRWDSAVRTKTSEPFKLSNDFRSRYARLIMANEPDLAGVFNLRRLEAA